jgi:hypothetical protein
MEGFSFVTPVTGLNRPNTGKDDDDETNLPKVSLLPVHHQGGPDI